MRLAFEVFEGHSSNVGDVVLIHGTGAKSELWKPQIQLLVEQGYRCIVPDLRGHGKSKEPKEKTCINIHLQDIEETISDCQLRHPAIFVGHSLGAIISMELFTKHPEWFDRILAISLPGRVPTITVKTFQMFLGWPWKFIRHFDLQKYFALREKILLETNHHSLVQIVENFAHLNYIDPVPQINCPVHFAVGRLDPIAPWSLVEHMHKQIPNSTFKIIEWAGHNCMDSQPQQFNRWFLEKIT